MNQALLSRVLQDDPEAIAAFGESDHCAVIDWRDGLAEIVGAVSAFLPDHYLAVEQLPDHQYNLLAGGRPPAPVSVLPNVKQVALISAVNEAIQPEFELRQFTPFDGDSYSLFVAPRVVWSAMERDHPKSTERLFLSAARLASYWSKSYLSRIFSKP